MALTAASCSAAKNATHPNTSNAPVRNSARLDQPPEGPPRLFHTAIDESFWVSHGTDRDRLISFGVRLEVSASTGEVFGATWEIDNELKSDPLLGALEVAPRLGGGFIHWSRNQLFRSETFTGPLTPITSRHALGPDGIRGARNGLDTIIVFGENANARLDPGKLSLDPPPFAGLLDYAALDDKRAVRIDAVGRVHTTIDGGKTWIDASGTAGISLKQLLVEPDTISIHTWQGRLKFNLDGSLGPLETAFVGARRGLNYSTIFRGSRAEDTNAWWTWREVAPVQAAVLGGARTDAHHAIAFATGALGEVNLATGELSRAITDWPQPGLSCSAVAGPEESLFICGWDTYQGYGSYVLRAQGNAWPPVIERAFTDDGFYVTDDHGALGFVGSCSTTPRYFDPNDSSRIDMSSDTYRVPTQICVRRGPNEWIEHEVQLDADSTLQAWAATRDGNAVALVMPREAAPMPDRTNDLGRVTTQGGVRIVRVPRDVSGFSLGRPNWSPYGSSGRTPGGPLVERRVRVLEDGTIAAWFPALSNTDPGSGIHAGALIDLRGNITLSQPPPRAVTMIATSPYGVALLADGSLVETTDHGRTYRSAGASPVPTTAFTGYCTMLGCVFGSVTRLGWGMPATNPTTVNPSRLDAESPPTPPVRLECSAVAPPEVVDDKLLHKGNRQSWMTGAGDVVSLFREVENLPDTPPQVPPSQPPDDAPPDVVAPPTKPRRPTTRTQSLLFRAPFDPDALPKRLDATSSELDNIRRLGVFPLLDKDGDVALLLISDKNEVLVSGDELTTLPLFENRRYMSDDTRNPTGLVLGPNSVLILGDVRRRTTLEEHGLGPQKAPVYLSQERDSSTRRPMALARRNDGTQGLLVSEGFPAGAVAVAEIDAKARAFLPFTPLASWSTATMGDDPRCKDVRGWMALVSIDPTLWFDVKPLAAAGFDVNAQGMLLVRWGAERVCVDALEMGVEPRTAYEWRYDSHLVMRWLSIGKKRRGGQLLLDGTRRKMECRLTSVAEKTRQ